MFGAGLPDGLDAGEPRPGAAGADTTGAGAGAIAGAAGAGDVPDAAATAGPAGVVREVEIVASDVTIQAGNGVVEMVHETVMQEVQGPAEVNGAPDHHMDVQTDALVQTQSQSQSQSQLQLPLPFPQVQLQSQVPLQPQPQPQPQFQAQAQLQAPAPVPPEAPVPVRLYDTDLERIHTDLYKGKYLTPQDFLVDIRKIVHNATVCARQDGDRLHKAQAMLTAAEMSVLELFDAQFRLECERMAGRERKRRAERKKEKGRSAACAGQNGGAANGAGGNGAYAPGTRRSARHNGQQPEIQITDPLQLERRLKRARSAGDGERPSGSPEAGAGGEDKPEESGASPRQQKRARTIALSDDEDHDPIDLLGLPAASQQGQRRPPVSVRFANDGQPMPMPAPEQHQHEQTAPNVNGWMDAMMVDYPAPALRHDVLDSFMHVAQQQQPVSVPVPEKAPPMSISHLLNGDTHASSSHTHTPVLSPRPQVHNDLQPPLFPAAAAAVVATAQPEPSPPLTPVPSMSTDEVPQASGAEPMCVSPPREPSRPPTPLPEFHVDEELMFTLQHKLTTRTDQLSVETLEQLRAMCLGCVWRHRAEWNRDALVREILGVLDEFLDDFADSGGDVNAVPSPVAY